MLEKKVITGLIAIPEDKTMNVREDTVVYENDIELSRTFRRYTVLPGDDVSGLPEEVQKVYNILWPPEAVQRWKERMKKEEDRIIRGIDG